ncbi:MAG: (d)CMP kinase [Clostridia bacterium]|nr:(d)CMP kinase [Clostridia bacterium]
MRIAVIGGGASGMMAAYSAAPFAEVVLFEKNSGCGAKLNITGKGRCNLTNNCPVPELIGNTVKNGKFLYSAFSGFDSGKAMELFEKLGVPLKTERGNRVFPVSDNAKDVTGALKTALHRSGVKIIHAEVTDVYAESGVVKGVIASGKKTPFDKVIVASGGVSYPKTGSTGDGYRFALKLGHTVSSLTPSLVPLYVEGSIPGRLEGLSLKNISITVSKGSEKIYSDFGEMLFTSRGVSGPMILSASSHLGRKDTFPYTLSIDLKPALDFDTLDKRILNDFKENINRDFSNSLSKLLPSKLIPVFIDTCGISPDKKVNNITKAERETICRSLKDFRLTLSGFYPISDAIITSGGVSVKEIDPKTMESKLIKGLYFCGEVIDVDAYTGGFNLQIAWSTGRCAGLSAAKGETKMKKYSVAIDGPSGAGKSTIAKSAAKELGIVYVDTGAIYRSVGLYVLKQGVDPKDKNTVIALLPDVKPEIKYEDGAQHIYLNGEDVSGLIRTETISKYASDVSAIPEVRAFLLALQRNTAKKTSVIMDGRDIGTVVLPDADVKIFLTASPEKRAERRYKELLDRGEKADFNEVLAAIKERDKNDSTRAAAPLKQAEDAILVDSSDFNKEETIARVLEIIKSKTKV